MNVVSEIPNSNSNASSSSPVKGKGKGVMAALAHALLGVPSRCGLCRAFNPKDNYKLCVWGFSRVIARYGISISSVSTRKKDGGNLTGSWALNAVGSLIVVHNATARATVEIPVNCYQVTASFH